MQRSLYWDLFNQNGMDFVTEISFCKTPSLLLMKKMLIFKQQTEVQSQLGKSYDVSECIKVTVSNVLSYSLITVSYKYLGNVMSYMFQHKKMHM